MISFRAWKCSSMIFFTSREFSYEAGNKCDPNQLDEDELEEELAAKNVVPVKRPSSGNSKQGQPQIQYRPQLAQY